ncbi:MAG: hypothetical protein JW702_02000 [Clostridiales bacterium]|nr:hypothetical protein [Clostridiales bacterium]
MYLLASIVILSMVGCSNNISTEDINKTEDEFVSESVNEDEESSVQETDQESIETRSPEATEFYNSMFVLNANIFLRMNQIPMVEDSNLLLEMKSEIKGFEKEFDDLLSNGKIEEEIEESANNFRKLIVLSYEAIDLSEKKLNGEDIKIFAILDKITEGQIIYLDFGKWIDSKGFELSQDTIDRIGAVTKEIIEKY